MVTNSQSIDISATPSRVWEVLTDTADYPEWYPFMAELSGTLRVGSRLAVTIQPPVPGSSDSRRPSPSSNPSEG